jgi:large subunit ribosomal protein L14
MVQNGSVLKVTDNSGANSAKIIAIPGKSRQRSATLGDIVSVVVKKASPNGTVKDGEVTKAVIVRTKKEQRRGDGSYIRFDDNAAVVIDNGGNPVGTRIFGPVAREIRDRGFLKIISLAQEVW